MKKILLSLALLSVSIGLVACGDASSPSKDGKESSKETYGAEIKDKTTVSKDKIKANLDTDLPSGMKFEILAKSASHTLETQTGETGIFGGMKGKFKEVPNDKYTITFKTIPLDKQSKEIQEKFKSGVNGQFIKDGVFVYTKTITVAESDLADEKPSSENPETNESASTVPTEYKSALSKAEQYSDAMKMSKAGIYDQLTSEYGEQFSAQAAQYAVDNLKADYNENALAIAKEYQESMQMSPAAIRDQLTSKHGEKFTASEANYAIKHLND